MSQENESLLKIRDLSVTFLSGKRLIPAVQHLDLDILPGHVLGLVGESGCGKSVTSLSIMGLNDMEFTRVSGSIQLEGKELVGLSERQMQHIRGDRMSMVFQEPMTSLNPVFTVGQQLVETLLVHGEKNKAAARQTALEFLRMVGLSDVERMMDTYPHKLSGGQRQRVMIAMALICKPALLIADEPTTALDVTIQAQVLDLIRDLMNERGTTLLLITHNLGIVAEMCDYVAVFYGGEIVEYGSKREIFKDPSHPYTIGLFGAVPSLNSDGDRLKPVEGIMPDPSDLPAGCKFHTRCPYATEACRNGDVPVVQLGGSHWCQCHHIEAVREAQKKEEAAG